MDRSRSRRWPFATTRSSQALLLGRLTELQTVPLGGGPDPEFRARLREGLLSASLETPERALTPSPAPRGTQGALWRPQLLSVGFAMAMVCVAFAAALTAPGDLLFPLKRAAQSTVSRLTDDGSEQSGHGALAGGTPIAEVAALLGAPGGGPQVGATVQAMEPRTRSTMYPISRAVPRAKAADKPSRPRPGIIEPFLPEMDRGEGDQGDEHLAYIDELVPPR